MIPKIIHYCWFGGNPMPQDVLNYIDGCKKLNPDYEIKIWSEENFDYTCNQYAKEAYMNKKFAFVTDYVRLKVLYDFGGIYMDTDVEVLKNFDELLINHAFSGFEGKDRIPTGTMGAEPGNHWIKLLLTDYDNKRFVMSNGSFDLTTNVTTITNTTKRNYPIVLNNSYQNLGDVTFYPFDYLCAKDLDDGTVKTTNNTYTIHHFKGSWTSPKKKFINFLNRTIGNDFVKFVVKVKHGIEGYKKS